MRGLDLRDPVTIFAAWFLVPALVVVASAGLGWLLARVSRDGLGALTLPSGFLLGVALTTVFLSVGLSGRVSIALTTLAALAGLALTARDARRDGWRPRVESPLLWPALALVATYAIGLAPVVGSGRSAMLGYGLLGDPAVHITLVEQMAKGYAEVDRPTLDSVHAATRDLDLGYPLGSYAWPLFGRVLTGVGPFHLWAPMSALVLAMMALVAYALLRTLLLPRALAAAAGTLIGTGYLMYSYHVQGGTKEVLMPVAVYATTALAARALERPLTWRSLLPAAVAALAALSNLGAAAVGWIGPPALVLLALLAWRARRAGWGANWRRFATPLAGAAAVLLVLGLPVALRTISFFNAAEGSIQSKSGEFANLLGPVPFREAWNVWIAHDYRVMHPDAHLLTDIGLWLAAAMAVIGIAYALARRNLAVPLTVLAGLGAVVIITPRASIYYDAKTYVAAAPALGVATAAGLLALARLPRPRLPLARPLAMGLASLLGLGVVASDAYVYSGVWLTPRFRFEELGQIADRTRGQGPLLVNDFEEWAPYILRDSQPWQERAFRWPYRLTRLPGNLPPVRAMDPDDYQLHHIEFFHLIVQRKRPYDSRPPANFRVAYETPRYLVWRRAGPGPRAHVPLGFDGRQGTGVLACRVRGGEPRDRAARALFAQARKDGSPIRAAIGPDPPVVAVDPRSWANFRLGVLFKPPEFTAGFGGAASNEIDLPAGRWRAWTAGSMGTGVLLHVRALRDPYFHFAGHADNDNGVPDAWSPTGFVVWGGGKMVVQLSAVTRPFWKAGSQHYNVVGPLVFTREGAGARIVDVPANRARSLCGQRLDWLELPPA